MEMDLERWIASQDMYRPERIPRIQQQILAGIEHLHRCEVVHRDIKCSNILINSMENDLVKVRVSANSTNGGWGRGGVSKM